MKELLLKVNIVYSSLNNSFLLSPDVAHAAQALLHAVLLVPAVDAVAHAGQLLDDGLELALGPRLAPVLQHAAPALVALVVVCAQSGGFSDVITSPGPAVELVHFP